MPTPPTPTTPGRRLCRWYYRLHGILGEDEADAIYSDEMLYWDALAEAAQRAAEEAAKEGR